MWNEEQDNAFEGEAGPSCSASVAVNEAHNVTAEGEEHHVQVTSRLKASLLSTDVDLPDLPDAVLSPTARLGAIGGLDGDVYGAGRWGDGTSISWAMAFLQILMGVMGLSSEWLIHAGSYY